MCSLLFMRNNKKVFQVEGEIIFLSKSCFHFHFFFFFAMFIFLGFVPAEEQMQLVAHFFFGAPKNLTVDKFS